MENQLKLERRESPDLLLALVLGIKNARHMIPGQYHGIRKLFSAIVAIVQYSLRKLHLTGKAGLTKSESGKKDADGNYRSGL